MRQDADAHGCALVNRTGRPARERKGKNSMRVRRVTSGDWTFGQGAANYATGGEAVRQLIITRLKSFKYDWFLDMSAGIDWIGIFGNKNTMGIIRREVWRVIRDTEGIRDIKDISINVIDRKATITVSVVTAYDSEFTETIDIGAA
ncbi:MAG: hypothetical protein LBH05_07850 [Deferribacteraceae bacterium]|nr:hypothetical protein [Deferribacteraceae bacterium]